MSFQCRFSFCRTFIFYLKPEKSILLLAADGRCWAVGTARVLASVKKKRPAQEVLCWAFFERWARNIQAIV